jgi:hypothetical protein
MRRTISIASRSLKAKGASRDALSIVSVARRPAHRAGEDHVVHLAAAQPPRRGLAHHPAQRLDEVRLSAAVRPDDPGQPRLDR